MTKLERVLVVAICLTLAAALSLAAYDFYEGTQQGGVMSDTVKGFIVTLEDDIRESSAKRLRDAILIHQGVVSVKLLIEDVDHCIAVEQAKGEMRSKFIEIIRREE